MSQHAERIVENVARVRQRIADAAQRAGRAADTVRLVAVTKYVGPDEIRALALAGCTDIGESRPQDLWRKVEQLSDVAIRWHLIGHLQRNKARRTLPRVSLIHSADSLRLLETLNELAVESARHVPVLLEVNISGDDTKGGFVPHEMASLLPRISELPHLEVCGLMTIASRTGGREQARRDFAKLRELRDDLRPECSPDVTLEELSMGMSDDFDIAIEEGATIIRVGSALFEGALT